MTRKLMKGMAVLVGASALLVAGAVLTHAVANDTVPEEHRLQCTDEQWPAEAGGWVVTADTDLQVSPEPDSAPVGSLEEGAMVVDVTAGTPAGWIQVACTTWNGPEIGFIQAEAVEPVLGCADVRVPRPGTMWEVHQWRTITATALTEPDGTSLGRLRAGTTLGDKGQGTGEWQLVTCWQTRSWIGDGGGVETAVLQRDALVAWVPASDVTPVG